MAFPLVLTAATVMVFVDICWMNFGWARTVAPQETLFHYWLLILMLSSCLVWSYLGVRGRVPKAASAGFVLSAFGLSATHLCHFFVYGLPETYGSHSVLEETASDQLHLLITAHRYGGPAAVLVGLLLVLLGSLGPQRSEG